MAPPAKPQSPEYLYGLSLLRFIAAALVVLFHFGTYGRSSPQQWAPLEDRAFPMLDGWTIYGQLGVQFFFILSGFVIFMSAQNSTAASFVQRRFLRLAPVLWTCATLALVVRVAISGEPTERLMDWARTVVLMPKGPYIDGVVWTLVVEAIFYTLIALLIWKSLDTRQISKTLDRFALVMGAVSSGYLVVDLGLNFAGPEAAHLLDSHAFKLLLLNHGVFFAAGMLLYSHRFGTPARHKAIAVGVFLTLGALQVALEFGVNNFTMIPILLYVGLIGLTFASIRYSGQIARYAPLGLIQLLGQMSYPLYLAHFAVGMHFVPVLARYIQSEGLLLVVSLGLLLANSYVITTMIEPRLLRVLKRALGRGRSPTVSSQA